MGLLVDGALHVTCVVVCTVTRVVFGRPRFMCNWVSVAL